MLLVPALWCAMTLAFADDSYFPIKKKAGDEGVTAFEAQWYGKSLERMKEPRLPDFAKDVNVEVYRMMILPTWGNSIVVRVQRHRKLYNLSARRLDGQAGYDPGKLVEAKDSRFEYGRFKRARSPYSESQLFPAFHKRWCAPSCDPEKRKLTAFLALCRFLLDKSTLSERPKNKGHKLI